MWLVPSYMDDVHERGLEKQLDVIGGRMWGTNKRNFYFLRRSLEQEIIDELRSTVCRN